ncbi:extracellular solute-binding protein [Candidatus Phytoplasma sacchari]|nr:extracellular solute-binding protein [Candidatus Phytoplasma sacchari]KAB8122881.1 extracellular solute-binding protein [Candidatus Phytoplasma sacchari]
MVLKVNLKDILIVICFFVIIIFVIIIDNLLRPKLNLQKIQKDYSKLEQIIKKDFKNNFFQQKYFENKKVKIVFWHNLYPHEQTLMNEIINEFQIKFPNIEVLNFSKGNWHQISKSIANSLPVNKQPHLSFSYPDHVQFYSKSNKIVPLSIFIENDEEFKNNEKNEFFPIFLPKISLSNNLNDENYFFFPFLKTTEIMFYNSKIIKEIKDKDFQQSPELKKILDQKINKDGIIVQSLEWEDLRILCSVIKNNKKEEKDFIPIIVESESNFFIIDNEQRQKNPLPSNKQEAKYFFNNPEEVKEKIIYFKENFVDKGLLTTTKLSGEGSLEEFFIEQKSCFFISSSRRCSTVFSNHFNTEITNFPIYCSNNNSKSNSCDKKLLLQGANINLFYSENKDEMLASWVFLKYLTSKEIFIKIIRNSPGIVFSRKDVKQHFLQEKNKNDKSIQDITSELENNNKNLSKKENLKKRALLLHYKFINFALTLKDNNKQDSFFSTPSYEESSLFRKIITELFVDVLSLDNSKKEYNLKNEINILFNETIERISSNISA